MLLESAAVCSAESFAGAAPSGRDLERVEARKESRRIADMLALVA